LTHGDDGAMKERRSLSFAGSVAVTIILDARGRPATDPVVICLGLPDEVVEAAKAAASDAQDRFVRKFDDDKRAAEEIRRAVRREIQDVWGKKSLVRVEVAHTG
jgi:ribonuclease J